MLKRHFRFDLFFTIFIINGNYGNELQNVFKGEDNRNGGLGFGGQSPVIQKAGKIKYLTDEPRALIERGEYMTNGSILFGANEGEGFIINNILYCTYIYI